MSQEVRSVAVPFVHLLFTDRVVFLEGAPHCVALRRAARTGSHGPLQRGLDRSATVPMEAGTSFSILR